MFFSVIPYLSGGQKYVFIRIRKDAMFICSYVHMFICSHVHLFNGLVTACELNNAGHRNM